MWLTALLALVALLPALAPARKPAPKTPRPTTAPDFFGCTVDSDCTFVLLKTLDNCCTNGLKVAVNASEVRCGLASGRRDRSTSPASPAAANRSSHL